jgi:hypothetical protein
MQREAMAGVWRVSALAVMLCFTARGAARAQEAPAVPVAQATVQDQDKSASHITPEQARQLFSLVDELLKFSSEETGLPIKSNVKRKITSRAEVESYLSEKFEEDEGAKRLQRGEIVLKKFGLLDRDFALKPFLLALLKEQIEAYYDSKTKTVYMLDWVDIEEQKPVLAHELTHALQDQHSDLEKWNDQTPANVSRNSSEDTDHLAKDEMDTAREAVVEGQATAVMMDYALKPMGKSLVKDPDVLELMKQQMSNSDSSPVLARAPIMLSESMLFPYREGLSFEQDVWMDQGRAAAFAGAMDHPPTSSWEILNPRDYEKKHLPPVPLLPDIHPLVDKLYKPYDIGQMGQLDLHILAEVYGGEDAARDLTPAWDGGLYWAGQRLSAKTPAEQASTKSISLFYLSAWKNAASAQAFAQMYADALGRKYSGLKAELAAESAPSASLTAGEPESVSEEQVYSTSEGPVVIVTRGKLVFVSESFDLDLARQLAALVLDAQGVGELKMAQAQPSGFPNPDAATKLRAPSLRSLFEEKTEARVGKREFQPAASSHPQMPGAPGLDSETGESANLNQAESLQPLSAGLIRFFSNCGVMKAVVEAAVEAAR